MREALGLVEISGLSTAILVADSMVKAANVQIIEIENTKGLGYMTIKISGNVGAVNAAVSAGKQLASLHGKFVSSKVIARPSEGVATTFVEVHLVEQEEVVNQRLATQENNEMPNQEENNQKETVTIDKKETTKPRKRKNKEKPES